MKISELPNGIREKALEYQKQEGNTYYYDLSLAFNWNITKEGWDYWDKLCEAKPTQDKPNHYDNSNGSIYKFCEEQKLNSYEFDLIKRIVRCRKKGQFIEDLEKTKILIDLYLKEQKDGK